MNPTDELLCRYRWVELALGLASLALGLWLIVRPFSSLSTLVLLVGTGLVLSGVSRLTDDSARSATRLLGALWVVGGAAILLVPQVSMRWLVIGGRAAPDRRRPGRHVGRHEGAGRPPRRLVPPRSGHRRVRNPRPLVAGRDRARDRHRVRGPTHHLRDQQSAQGGAPGPPRDDDDSRGPSRRWARVVGAALSLAAAGALAWLSSALNDGRPVVDAFYAAPDQVPGTPGHLLRQEPFERGIPDDALAWRILYTTTRDEGRPAVASAIVVAPGGGKPGAREVIAHPYLIGQGEARSVLDAVRAARQMPELDLAERTVVWGHSQGGHAALWTGAIGPSYAPEVDLIGVAALAPASNLVALVDNLGNVTGGSIFAAYASRPTPPTIRTSGLPTTWSQGRGSRSRRSRVAVCRSPRC